MRNYRITLIVIITALIIACQSNGEKKSTTSPTSKPKPKKEVAKINGEKIYKMNCVVCHGMDGNLGLNGSKDINASELTLEERIELVAKGKNTMTPFEALLKEDQIKAVAEYTFKL